MTGRLAGKTALCTASGQGIGRATVEMFLREGASVIATDVDPGKLAGLDADCRALDALDGDAITAMAADVGAVDILFNCTGFVHHGTILDCSDEAWDFSFNLNVTAQHRMARAFLPAMLEAGGGSIINMSSAAGSIKGAPNRYVYGATKAAVIGMTKAIAADFITQGIRCNAICPGTVFSPSWEERAEALGQEMSDVEEAKKLFIARQPMGRLGTAEEIAALATYLASDESAFTTGQAHLIDGGWTL